LDCTWTSGSQKSYYQCGGPKVPEDKGTTATGVFPFVIKMRNELKGIDQTLFTGKVKIEKAPDENGTPAERAKKSFYYPNMDWALPIGYVYYSPADNHLYTAFWVRGSTYKVEPHLFYQGKEIGLEGKSSCNDGMEVGDAYIRTVKPAPRWKLVECEMTSAVKISDKGEKFAIPIHYLMSSPGDYEIKVLWNDELSRSIKFTVGTGGDFKSGVPCSTGCGTETGIDCPASSCPSPSSTRRTGRGTKTPGGPTPSTATRRRAFAAAVRRGHK